MNWLRCKKGHFYDAEKYDSCPYCIDSEDMNVQLPPELSFFKTQKILGESKTSKVFRMIPKGNYALKVIDITESKMEFAVDHEYRIAKKLEGEKYFVDYYALYKQGGMAYIVQPELRNLLTYIEEENPNLRQILKILKDIVRAIGILSEKGILHLDIKPTNIFVDENGNGKLGDFSIACEITTFKEKPFQAGTSKYFSPEVYEKTGYSGKEDMYSLGISMYYILSGGKYPYDFEKAETRTADSVYIANELIPKELQCVIKKATAYNPDERYNSMEEMYNDFPQLGQESESYKVFSTSTYYEGDIAYSIAAPSVDYRVGIDEDTKGKFEEENEIPVSTENIVSDVCFCSECGARNDSLAMFCIHCGNRLSGMKSSQVMPAMPAMPRNACDFYLDDLSTAPFSYGEEKNVQNQYLPLEISKVHFSAIAPRTMLKGEYTIINILMYQEAFRSVVDELISEAEVAVHETKSGTVRVKEGARVKIQLTSPDITIEDNVEEQEWSGEYLTFNFAVMIPDKYTKRQVLFTAAVYINDVIATRLKFVVKCWSLRQQKIEVIQEDVLSAFVSYASQDRNRVAMIIQGMKKVRPDMDIFFDVQSLRSGESWDETLWSEIDQRDTLFLCWSHNAAKSSWVAKEWRYCYEQKGAEAIEPIPLEPPTNCPPPKELEGKHFNDWLLYVINAESAD